MRQCNCHMDLDLASHVQQLLFPKSLPQCDWCCIGIKNRMAEGLGGDYFDFIDMPDGCQALFIGDVTGHGLHASVVMSLLYGFIHRSAQGLCAPVEMVQQANAFLLTFAGRSRVFDHFFSSTLFWGIIHPQTLQMHFVNAGHPGPMIRRGQEVLVLPPTAPPIGFFGQPEITAGTFLFEADDRLLLYTDGITEAVNAQGQLFGQSGLRRILVEKDGDHLQFLEQLFQALREFGSVDPPTDDCTAIVLDFHS